MTEAPSERPIDMAVLFEILAHPTRTDILAHLSERRASPKEMARALGADIGVVNYHTRRLEDAGAALLAKKERPTGRRGHPEKYYEAQPVSIADSEWLRVPRYVRAALTHAALRELASGLARKSSGAARADDTSRVAFERVRDELVSMLGVVAASLLQIVDDLERRGTR